MISADLPVLISPKTTISTRPGFELLGHVVELFEIALERGAFLLAAAGELVDGVADGGEGGVVVGVARRGCDSRLARRGIGQLVPIAGEIVGHVFSGVACDAVAIAYYILSRRKRRR